MKTCIFVIGNFDGVHRGHQMLIQNALQYAKSKKLKTIIMTFWPHPQAVVRSMQELPLLHTQDERREALNKLGVDDVLFIHFTRDLSDLTWKEFIDQIVQKQKYQPVGVFIGSDFHFGKGREGNAEKMKDYLSTHGIEVFIVKKFKNNEEEISSTLIRNHLYAGEIHRADELLGRAYSIGGIVVRKDGRGRTIGFPTANLEPTPMSFGSKIIPHSGVYITKLKVDGDSHLSVTNIGHRPTFDKASSPIQIETHVLDAKLDLYGKSIEVEFYEFIRGEKKFENIEELKKQIHADCEYALNYWGGIGATPQ